CLLMITGPAKQRRREGCAARVLTCHCVMTDPGWSKVCRAFRAWPSAWLSPPGPQARSFQDHDVRPRMMKGRSMERPAHRVASVTSVRPDRRRAQMARLRRAAMILGPDRVLTCDLSSW